MERGNTALVDYARSSIANDTEVSYCHLWFGVSGVMLYMKVSCMGVSLFVRGARSILEGLVYEIHLRRCTLIHHIREVCKYAYRVKRMLCLD